MRTALTLMAALALGPAFVQAQAPAAPPPAAPDKPPPPPPFVTAKFNLGYVNTSGNTNVSTLNLSDQVVVNTSPVNKITQNFGLVYGTNENHVQTELWTASLKDEYSFTKHIGLYALVGFDRNTFAGINRRVEEGGGLAIVPIDAPHDRFEIDAGISYIEQQIVPTMVIDSSSTTYAAARGALIYRHTFIKDTYFQQTVEAIPDLRITQDYRVNSQSDVVAPVSKHIAIKVGYGIRYDNLPPVGFKTTDRLFTSDLQLTF
jgi:putative salt-induced outer membrane protein YdiY